MGELSHGVRSLPIEDHVGIKSITAQDTNDTTPALEMPDQRSHQHSQASGSSTVSVRQQHRQASGYVKRFAVAGRRVHRLSACVGELLEGVAQRKQLRLAECRAEE